MSTNKDKNRASSSNIGKEQGTIVEASEFSSRTSMDYPEEFLQRSKHQMEVDEITLNELILRLRKWYYYLLSKKKVIFISVIIGAVVGLIFSFIKKPVYNAETTFVLENGDNSGPLGNYAGLASMVGIDIGGASSGVFQGDNIIELYQSRAMIQKALLSMDAFDGKKQLLIDRYLDFNNIRAQWTDDQELVHLQFNGNSAAFNRTQDSIVSKVVKDIQDNYLNVDKPDKKLSIISVQVTAKDELFAKSFADNIVQTVNQFYVNTTTKKSSENLLILQHQADSVKRALNNSIAGAASAIDANPNNNMALQSLRVPSQEEQVDVQASGAVYAEILKNLELAKIALRQDQPLIQIIDKPIFPLKVSKLGKIVGTIIGAIICGFLTILVLACKKVYNNALTSHY